MSCTIKSALVSLFAAVALAPAALAQTPSESASVRVAYGDLNMSTRKGGEILLGRIEGAARKACKKVTVASPLTPQAINSCKRETVAGAVRNLNMATLTAAWEGAPVSTTVASR